MLIVRKETHKKPIYIYNKKLWFVKTICEKPIVQNSMRTVDPKDYLMRFLIFFWKLGQLSKPTPKIETNDFHEKVKTTQHWLGPTCYVQSMVYEYAT